MTNDGRTQVEARRFTRAEAAGIIAQLQRATVEELDGRFASGDVPPFAAIAGDTAGGWLARPEPRWWAEAFIRFGLDSPWARWTGKRFITPFDEGPIGSGINLFDNRLLPLRYPFRTYIKHAEFDGRPCFTLEYPFLSAMWGLIDDMRRIEPGVLLGRFEFRFPWQKRRRSLGYFVLVALAREPAEAG